jgi:hypothetical protein
MQTQGEGKQKNIAKELSAPVRGAQSFQETVEQGEETARHQAKLTTELKEEDPREDHATAKEPIEREERRPNTVGIGNDEQQPHNQVVQAGRTFSQVRNSDLPYTNMSSNSREETKTREEWTASKDIRPKKEEEPKESQAVTKGEGEENLKSNTPCRHGSQCYHLKEAGVCKFYHKQSHYAYKRFKSTKPCRNGKWCKRFDCAFVHKKSYTSLDVTYVILNVMANIN